MNREIVLVMGMTGWGKSWWSKLYHQGFSRSFVYDPAMSFQALYKPAEMIVDTLHENEHAPQNFRFGFVESEEAQQIGSLSFVLENNIMFLEECSAIFEKGQARMPDWAKRLCFYGRHRSCSIVLIAQRPTYIPIDFRSQANRVISFCQHETSDMDWLQDFFGREKMKSLTSLPKFTCFDWHNGICSQYSIVDRVRDVFGISLDMSQSNRIELVPSHT